MNDNPEQNELFSCVSPADDARSDGGETPASAPFRAAENPAPTAPPVIDDGSGEDPEPAEPAAPKLSRRAAPSIPPREQHRAAGPERTAASGAEFGARVRALRLKSGLSLEDVAAETLIKSDYLHAMEEGDFDALPASVYVTAYLRRLCRLYGASPAESDALVFQLHDHLVYEIPGHIAAKVHDLETDEREQRKLRQILFGIVATAVLFVLILAVAAAMLFAGTGRGRDTAVFDESMLLRLQPRAELKLSILPAREPGR